MKRGWRIVLAAAGAAIVVLVAGVAVTSYALAQDPDPEWPWHGEAPGLRMKSPRGPWLDGAPTPRFGMPEEMKEAIAGALGITVEELDDALAEGKTLYDIVDERNVDLTEVQAAMEAARQEMIEERLSQMPPAGWRLLYHDRMEEALAEALGLTVEELEAARADGQTLFEMAQAQELPLDDLREAMAAVHEEILEQAVSDGVLTEEQAEWLRDAERGFGPGLGPGMHLGPMGRCGGMRGGPGARGFSFGPGGPLGSRPWGRGH
jgi:hypothetical protein